MKRFFNSKEIEQGSDSYLYWRQEDIIDRFSGVEQDFSLIAKELFEAAKEYPVEYREGYLAGLNDALSGMDQSLRDRFNEISKAKQLNDNKEKEFWK